LEEEGSCQIRGKCITFNPILLSLKTNTQGNDQINDRVWQIHR
jgi:hypothetical protein